MFKLHEKLDKDLIFLGKLKLSRVFLLPDSDQTWVVLVPEIPNITELHQLDFDKQVILLEEINTISKLLEGEFSPDKLNIGALGNMVPQLHMHIICRYKTDKSWPGAIWGSKAGDDQSKIDGYIQRIKPKLGF